MQTHSPSQYMAALAASSSFCACDFLFPKTFKLVLVVAAGAVDTVNEGAFAEGMTKADDVENDKQIKARIREITEEKRFIVVMKVFEKG